jgi:hypothetical protein
MFAYARSLAFRNIEQSEREKRRQYQSSRGPAARGFPSELETQSWDFPMSLEPPSPGYLEKLQFSSFFGFVGEKSLA